VITHDMIRRFEIQVHTFEAAVAADGALADLSGLRALQSRAVDWKLRVEDVLTTDSGHATGETLLGLREQLQHLIEQCEFSRFEELAAIRSDLAEGGGSIGRSILLAAEAAGSWELTGDGLAITGPTGQITHLVRC
jgi:hypothetical protein